MVYRMLTILTAIFLFIALSASAQDPGQPDTLRIDSIQVDPGEQAVLDITFFNDEELGGLQVPLTWSIPDITLDSVSFVGSRVDYVGTLLSNIDNPNQKVLTIVILLFEDPIPAGDGLYARFYFDIPPGTPDQKVYVDTLSYTSSDNLVFAINASNTFLPIVDPGMIVIGEPADPPTIGVSPASFAFEALAGQVTPDPQILAVSNEGGDPLNWTATWDESWLEVLPAFGSVLAGVPQNVQVAINTTALTPGLYKDTIVVSDPTATNDPVKIPVEYNVVEPPPIISISPDEFIFNAVASGSNPPDQFLEIANDGYGTLEWTATNDSSWLILSPSSGTGDATVTVSIDITGLPFGVYYDTIVVSVPDATNDPQMAEVRLEVASDLPLIAVDTNYFFLNVTGISNPHNRVFTIFNGGGGSMNYSLQENSTRIVSLSPSSGAVPQAVTVGFKTIGGVEGDEYEDTVWVSSTEALNSPQPVVFHFRFTSSPDNIVVNMSSISDEYYECGQGMSGAPEQSFDLAITNQNGEPLDFALDWDSDWFELGATSGTTPAFYTPQFDYCGLAPGVYYDTLVIFAISAINNPVRIPLQLTILPTTETPELWADKDSLHFYPRVNKDSRIALITVNNVNPGCMEWSMTETIPWLISNIDSSNCKKYPWFISTYANGTSLPLGRYIDNIELSSPTATNSPIVIEVTADVWAYYGDTDWDGKIDLLDIIYMIRYIFYDEAEPMPFKLIGDVNCDRKLDLLDVLRMIDYKFYHGEPYCGNVSK